MKLREIMSRNVLSVASEESVEVAARTLAQHNVGALAVVNGNGKLCGVVTDRDLVIRCMAAGRTPAQTKVSQVMTKGVTVAESEMDVGVAAHLMGRRQVRRLPVVEKGRLCGMVSLGDIARWEACAMDAAEALSDIAGQMSDG